MSSTTATHQHRSLFQAAATWPPLVYVILGAVLLLFWAAGTAVQVQTSEAWIARSAVSNLPTLQTFGQIWDFVMGRLPSDQIVPFTFAWGVQLALIVASVGLELPKYPRWRYVLAWCVVVGLIGINSAGDFAYAAPYGFWGQSGFTIVVLFVTFCLGLLAIMCFIHALGKMMKAPTTQGA